MSCAIAGVGITAEILTHDVAVVLVMENRIGEGDGEDAIVSKKGFRAKEGEFPGLDVVPFVNGTDDVTRYGAQHGILRSSLITSILNMSRTPRVWILIN